VCKIWTKNSQPFGENVRNPQVDFFSRFIILGGDVVIALRDHSLFYKKKQFYVIVCLSAELRSKRSVHLWQFLKELLMCPASYQNAIRWLDRHKGWCTLLFTRITRSAPVLLSAVYSPSFFLRVTYDPECQTSYIENKKAVLSQRWPRNAPYTGCV